MGRRAQGVSLRTPKDQMLKLLLKINQTLEFTLRREEIPFWWNTVEVLWGAWVVVARSAAVTRQDSSAFSGPAGQGQGFVADLFVAFT